MNITIYIDPNGDVTITTLTRELLPLALELAGGGGEGLCGAAGRGCEGNRIITHREASASAEAEPADVLGYILQEGQNHGAEAC